MKESEKCREFTHFNRFQLLPSEHENDENKREKKLTEDAINYLRLKT